MLINELTLRGDVVWSGAVSAGLGQSAQWLAGEVSGECSGSWFWWSSLHLHMIMAASSVPVRVIFRISSSFSRRVSLLCGRVRGHLARLEVKLVRGWGSLEAGVWWPFSRVISARWLGWGSRTQLVLVTISVTVRTELGVVRVSAARGGKIWLARPSWWEAGWWWLHGWLRSAETKPLVEVSVVGRVEDGGTHGAGSQLGVRNGNSSRWFGRWWPGSQGSRLQVSLVIDSVARRCPGSGAGSSSLSAVVPVHSINSSIRQPLHLQTVSLVSRYFARKL